MKCDKCFFCTHIGAGIYAPYPVKYCKYKKEYKVPLLQTGELKFRQLDFSNMHDLRIWREVGCDIHPQTVKKAKNDFIKSLESTE